MSAARCRTCKHYAPHDGPTGHSGGGGVEHGACSSPKFVKGYHAGFGVPDVGERWDPVPVDGVLVEDDEGWGFYVGADFGCVHHDSR